MGTGTPLPHLNIMLATPQLSAAHVITIAAVCVVDAVAVLLLAAMAAHWMRIARLHVRAARARRLTARQAVETTALAVGQACRVDVCAPGNVPVDGALEEVERRHLTLHIPRIDAAPRPGTPIVVTAVGPSAAYRFVSVVRDAREQNGSWRLHLPRPPWVEKVQRRDFFRVPIDTATVVYARTPGSTEPAVMSCSLTNLSAGGARLMSPRELAPGSALAVRVPTADAIETRFEARVTRCTPASGRDGHYEIGCRFERMDEDTRSRLLAHCFDIERAGRRLRGK